MAFFQYDKHCQYVEYYELLEVLMKTWENEIVEFKEAKNHFDTDKIGRYFSAISNEANLRHRQYGWLIFGISENGEGKHVVGTSFKQGDVSLLQKFKYEISKNTTNGISFFDIIEIFPMVDDVKKRVLMFKIPAATTGIPTDWKNNYYERCGESLDTLKQYKIDTIRSQERMDWSKQILNNSGIANLDKDAILLARTKYKEKMNNAHISKEIDAMSDEQFLTKLKLMIDGKLTNACMLLLGNSDYDYLFTSIPSIMWRLFSSTGETKDYCIFKIPFINVVDSVFLKVRNLVYRYMPNQLSLFPTETEQYDTWLIRELLNNCIAHSDYRLGGRIYVNEFEDKLLFTNPGDFIPQKIENVLDISYSPPFYRNQLLAEAMVAFHMIDTATLGIRRAYTIQKSKYFPMPDYNIKTTPQVEVTVYGKILDDTYMHILYDNPDLDLQTVFLLDRVQKNLPIGKDEIATLRKQKLIEGRAPNVYLSSAVSKALNDSAGYIKNRGFDNKYYRDLIVDYLTTFKTATRSDIRTLLFDKLPDVLSEGQKENKIKNLLASLRDKDVIQIVSGKGQKATWALK